MAKREEVRFDIEARDRTKTAFDAVDRRLGNVTRMAARMGAGIAAGAAVAGTALTVLTKKSIDFADALAKQADRIGVSTDALQEYRHAAQLSGVSTEQLDVGLLKFSQTIGRLRMGTGELAEFLRKSDQQLMRNLISTRSTDQALNVLFTTLGNTADASQRNALAAAAFGEAGLKMTTMVRDGTGGLSAMRGEAHDLGLVIREDLLRGAEMAGDEINKLGRIVSTQASQAVLELMPLIIKLTKRFVDLAPEISAATEKVLKFIGVIDELSAATQTADINKRLQELSEEIFKTKNLLDGASNPRNKIAFERRLQNLNGEAQQLVDKLNELRAAEAAVGARGVGARKNDEIDPDPVGGGVPVVTGAGGDFRGAKPQQKPVLGLDPINTTEQLQAEIAAVRAATQEFARLGAAYDESEAAGQRMAEAIATENEVRAAGLDVQSAEGQQLTQAINLRNALSTSVDARIQQLQQEKQFQEQLGDAMVDTAEGAINDLINGYGDLKSVGLKVLSSLILRTFDLGKAMSANGGGGGVGGMLGGLLSAGGSAFGGLFGGGGAAASSASMSRAAAAGAFTTFRPTGGGFGFADGGIADRASIFGEAGPEAAVPLPDGRTIPVTLKGGGEGGGGFVYIDARGAGPGVEAKIEAVLARRMPGIVHASAQLAEHRVGQARRRNRLSA